MLRFLKFLSWGNCFEKKKIDIFWIFFLEIFKILKIRDTSFVPLLILRHFIKVD